MIVDASVVARLQTIRQVATYLLIESDLDLVHLFEMLADRVGRKYQYSPSSQVTRQWLARMVEELVIVQEEFADVSEAEAFFGGAVGVGDTQLQLELRQFLESIGSFLPADVSQDTNQ